MKRSVIFLTVWAMGLAGVLASVVLPSSASAQLPVAAAAVSPGSFTPLSTARVFDGTATTTPRQVQIAGLGGVPADATAVMVNTEVFAPTAAGYVRVTPAGQDPGVATQQFAKGQAISNMVAVMLVSGRVQVKVSAGSARILMDVSGYYSAKAGAYFTPLPTARVFAGTATTTPRQVQIAGLVGVPANATAVMVNTEVFAPTAAGYVRVTPAGQNPGVALQEFAKGQAISNLMALKLVGGKVQAKVSSGSAQILMDVSGYYSARAGASFTPVPPARVFAGTATTTPRQVQIAGLVGVPANATAVMVNTGVFASTAAGYARVTPAGLNPGVAVQEFAKGRAISNLAAVKLVGGRVQAKVSAGSAGLVMEVSGYYIAGAPDVTRPGPVTGVPVPPVVTPPGPVTGVPVPPVSNPPGPVTGVPVPPVVTPPGPVTGLSATGASDTSIALAWSNPTDASFAGVTIRRALGATAPATVTDGTLVTLPASATATSFTDTGLTAGTQYSYAVFAHDGVPNFASAAKATGSTTGVTTTGVTTAVLSVSSSGVATTNITVGAPFLFDASGSHAGPAGTTVKTVSLNFGDGTTPASLTGDPAYWWDAHSYVAVGTYSATLTVTDSGNATASKVVTVTVSPAPTAAIAIQGNPTSVHVGAPVTFTLTSSTPLGTAIKSWTVYDVWLDGGYGTLPPATVTHTFDAPGTYTVQFDLSNDAMGLAQSSIAITVLP